MIIEIWRKPVGPGLPVCFTKDEQPKYISDAGTLAAITESPAVKKINYYETGAFSGKAFRGPCYVVQFEDSPARRIVPADQVLDVCWAVPVKEVIETPQLEG